MAIEQSGGIAAFSIAIRADASPEIGGGHVMRCLTLAHELARRGADVTFLVRPPTLETVPALVASGYPVVDVDDDPQSWCTAISARWPDGGADWVIVDSYRIGATEETALRTAARRVMVIDDLANRPHDCDLLLDQNLGRAASDYDGLVPPGATVLAGPRYALLRPEFAAARPAALARRAAAFAAREPVRCILVSLGLTDIGGITAEATQAVLEATSALAEPPAIDVVVGAHAPSLPTLKAIAAGQPQMTVHIDVDGPQMASLMAAADLAVGASGSSSWERCCLGLPTLMLVLADNQRAVAAELARLGAAVVLDHADLPQLLETGAGARLWITDRCAERSEMSQRASTIADGGGAAVISSYLLVHVCTSGLEPRSGTTVGVNLWP